LADLLARLQAAVGDTYRVEKELGGGGMSRLFLATESSLHRAVVIKLLPPEFTSEISTARFKQEFELAAHLQHPNILPVLTAGARDGLLFYVMPFVAGESLRHRLTRQGKFPVADSIRILNEVADALAHAHAEGVIHRDIKPENILLEGGHAVLTDFGVAKVLAESRSGGRLTESGFALGTPGYMSPEQAAGESDVDARADIYALAVVGYELLAGFPPFGGSTAQAVIAAHLTATPKPLTDVRSDTPPHVADAITRALAKDPRVRLRTAAEFRDALEGAVPRTRPAKPWIVAAIFGVLLALGVALTTRHSGARVALDPSLVAVVPFDVLDAKLELWREGLVDLLSRNLDGAGPLRTVPPSVVVQRWTGRADAPSAMALGRSTGARLAVFGQLVPTSAESVRITATLLDVASGQSLVEVEFRDLSANMDRLSDSLTVALLRELGRSRPIGAVRATALRATSLPALKAFLKGEQFFRRAAWDSALASYRRTVSIDSGFALAWRRMSKVLGWQVMGGDSLAEVYGLRAARLNWGLPPRESLLVSADSLALALFTNSADTAWRAHQARLFATLEEATRRYPQDPEVWYELGDARVHFPQIGRTSLEDVLEPFDRAIALDSALSESYIHAVEYALYLGRPALARQYIAAYLAHNPGTDDKHAQGLRLVDQFLVDTIAEGTDLDRRIAASSANALFEASLAASHASDSNEMAVRLTRALRASRSSGVPIYDDPLFRTSWLSSSLAYRGHLREASEVGGTSVRRSSEIAALGGAVSDSTAAMFRRWLRDPPLVAWPNALPFGFNVWLFNALPWWSARHDTLSLARFAVQMQSAVRRSPSDVHIWLDYGRRSAEAYLALAKGDTVTALRRFVSLPDTVCPCIFDQIIKAQLLLDRGRNSEAAAVFGGQHPPFMSPAEGLWRLQRARVLERLGRRDEALADYAFVVDVWRHADPELQPYVVEARAALKLLGAEPR
jgi:serine/threonine-protein kinase